MDERRFTIERGEHRVPAIVWRPEATGPIPLVLAGHGGGGHKRDPFVLGLRDRLLPRGIAVAAIDAVGHGERIEGVPTPEDVIRVISDPASYDRMIADWTAALDALLASGDFEADLAAYAGLSGGTLFGLPFVASEQRIRAAVVGACGTAGAPMLGDAPSVFAPRLLAAAHRYDRAALFLLQAEDDFFPPAGGRALYRELAANEKRLIESPGTHTEVPPGALDEAASWLAGRLSARRRGAGRPD